MCFQPRGKSFGCSTIPASCDAEAGDADGVVAARPEEDEALVFGMTNYPKQPQQRRRHAAVYDVHVHAQGLT